MYSRGQHYSLFTVKDSDYLCLFIQYLDSLAPTPGRGGVAGRLGLETKLELEEPLKGFPEAFTTNNDTRNKTK